MPEQRHDFENGKYTLILDANGYTVTALRGGEPWREFVGDKFVSGLVITFFEHRESLNKIRELLREPVPSDGFHLSGFATTYDQLADLYSETFAEALRDILEADDNG